MDRFRGILIAFVGLLLLSSLGGAYYWRLQYDEPLDTSYCPKSGPKAIHIVIIDRSDPISEFQAQRILQILGKAKNDAIVGTRFDVFTFEGDTGKRLDPILSICTPQKPDSANELYENRSRIRRRYDEDFSKVLDDTIGSLLKASSAPNSPIIESLRGAAQTSLGGNRSLVSSRRITLISDLVQHSVLHSHFRSDPVFPTLSKTNEWSQLRPSLHGAEIDVLYLLRPAARRGASPIQNRGHQLFWEQLIGASNGILRGMEPI